MTQKVESWPLDRLKPFSRNSRIHPRAQISQIKGSIEEFGFVNPIIVDQHGNIIAGHGRLIAARELGMESVPVIVIGHLTDVQIRALRIADNKIALNSGWDSELLKAELLALSVEIEIDIGVTGFSTGELEVVIGDRPDPDDDDIPAVRTEPKTKPGDIWQLDDHRVGCGDARDREFLKKLAGQDVMVDCAFLDSPYNVSISKHANVRRKHDEFAMASGEMSDAEFASFLTDIFSLCIEITRSGGVHFLCMDWRHAPLLSSVARPLYSEQLNLCIWNKSNAGMGSLYRSKHEMIFVYKVGSGSHLNNVELGKHGRNRTNVWDYPSVNTFQGRRRGDLDLHPTVKPVAMVADAIRDVTRRGDVVLDVFLGSDTTLIACERTERQFIGLDIDPSYVDLAVDRWVEMTGRTPKKIQEAASGWGQAN